MSRTGQLVMSLDFELLWGVFDVVNYRDKFEYFQRTRKVIPHILTLFQEYDIHATWAVVGMLFNKSWDEWENNRPSKIPFYNNINLSPYLFVDQLSTNEKENIKDLVFAPDLVDAVKKYGEFGQEIGTHTYSHFYSLEKGQDAQSFKKDLEKAIEVASAKGIETETLIFPRNQIKAEYLSICSALGIKNVRSNPNSWYWKNTLSDSFLTKVARSGDAYFPLGEKIYNPSAKEQQVIFEQKASRFLRPVENNKILRKLKLERIKKEITTAAQKHKVYHLWWHPHNFGDSPGESLKDLRHLLEHFKTCRKKYGMESINMRELGDFERKLY